MLARHHTGPVGPVTPVELFFDVVFVFTITQLTRVFEKDLSEKRFWQCAAGSGTPFD
jgi:hypothetical protein